VKRLLFVVALGALVVGASGCDLSPPAATVNGVSISQGDLNAALSTVIKDPAAQCASQIESGLTASPIGIGTEDDGSTPNAAATAFADDTLKILVLEKLEEQSLAQRSVKVNGADITAATTDYVAQLQEALDQAQSSNATPSGCTLSASKSVKTQLPAAYVRWQGTSLAAQEDFEEAVGHVNVSQSALEAYYAAHRSEVTQECLNLIVSDTQAAAQKVHDQIAGGATFATADASANADTAASPSSGQLPCAYPSQLSNLGTTLGATIDALSGGQLAAPLAWNTTNSSGASVTYYLVVQMRQHVLVPFATVRTALRQQILSANAQVVGATLDRLVRVSHVSVDPRYGGWNPTHGVITVPTPPAAAFVLNAAANVPVKSLFSIGGLNVNPAPG